MRNRLIKTLVPVLVAGTALFAAPTAFAAKGPCIPGTSSPTCIVWSGTVKSVDDGDTMKIRIAGKRVPYYRVRLTGVQAMEHIVYSTNPAKRRGECHALATTARVEQLVRRSRGRVRVAARRAGSRTGRRIRRSVAVRVGRRWQDVGEVLAAEGRVLPLPNPVEWHGNRRYADLAKQAAAKGIGLWNRERCGAGPGPVGGLKLWVNWDADGPDGYNPNGEWFKIRNTDDVDLPVGGWWVRDSHHRKYKFPAGTVIRAGATITVHIGRGANTATRFHWGIRPIFENATYDRRAMGDGGYLFDKQGDLRAEMIYPCRGACTDPLDDKLDLDVSYSDPEQVTIRNIGNESIDLDGYRLVNEPYSYPFAQHTVIGPGLTLKINVVGSPSSDRQLEKFWGLNKRVLDNAGDSVTIRTFTDHELNCVAWGIRAHRC